MFPKLIQIQVKLQECLEILMKQYQFLNISKMKQSNLKLSNTKLLQFMIIHKMTMLISSKKMFCVLSIPIIFALYYQPCFSRQILSRIHFAFCWHLLAQGNNSAPKLTNSLCKRCFSSHLFLKKSFYLFYPTGFFRTSMENLG